MSFRHIGVVALTSLAFATAVGTAGPSQAEPQPARPAAGAAADCTPLTPKATRHVARNGRTMAAAASSTEVADSATVQDYVLPDGSTMTTTTPPAGFRPQDADPATARAFGFDAPDDPTKLAAWRERYAGYRETAPAAPCMGRSGPLSAAWISYSSNWGGFVATGHSNYVEVYDDQNIPTYSTGCGTASTSIIGSWIGIGGYTTGRLIQQGFASGSSTSATTGARLWYEYLNDSHLNPPVYVASTTRTGDVISQYMTYSSGTVGFHWYDRTTGTGWPTVTKTGLSSYYDGTSADFITEKATSYLRKFSRQTFSAAGAAYGSTFADLFNLPVTETRLTTNGASSGAALLTSTRSSTSSFYQDWKRCS